MLKKKAKVNLHVPIDDMQISEDFHVIAMHNVYNFIRQLMNNKTIWYLNPWDALPNESGFDRSLSIITKLSRNNFNIVWWNTSSFSHAEKKFRERITLDNCELILLPGIQYKSNIEE